jgi:sugar phosphate isomerase/epimerase
MDLGLVVDPRLDRPWEDALDLVVRNGISHIEPCGGGHVPKDYLDPVALSASEDALDQFRGSVAARNLQIAALGCYGNPLHPDAERAQAAHEDLVAMCDVAAKLGVRRITVVSGLPAGGPEDRAPNWIVPSIYPDLENAYRWQWNERVIPYWKNACDVARASDVTICMEPIAGFVVYNGQTFLRLREACGDALRVNLDPSHLWWMGIDPIELIDQLGDSIAYAHAKDVSLDPRRIRRDGLVPACNYDDWDGRSWIYRAIGFGHPEAFWKDYLTALRRAGYDDVVSMEIEESFMSVEEAVAKSAEMVRRAMPADPIPEQNWFDKYEWESTKVE